MLIRCESFVSDTLVQELFDDAIKKEIEAITSPDKKSVLNYDAILGYEIRDNLRLSEHHPFNTDAAHDFSYQFHMWANAFAYQDRILYPRYQRRKNSSYTSQIDAISIDASLTWQYPLIGSKQFERMYVEGSRRIHGLNEMRVSFKYTDLKPRVYYCVGSDQYESSKYMRAIAVELCDLLPSTNRNLRYHTNRLASYLEEGTTFMIYDYSSFTSRLTEMKHFIDALADHLRETKVHVLDLSEGLTIQNLGEMIKSFNEDCNYPTLFDVSRITKDDPGTSIIMTSTNGMLGVQGNIGFSTLLHGIVIIVALGMSDLGNIVGDDAAIVFWTRMRRMIENVIGLLGICELSKAQSWVIDIAREQYGEVSSSWHFLKRPINVNVEYGLDLGILPAFPLLVYAFGPTSNLRTDLGSSKDRLYSFISNLSAFFWQIHSISDQISENDVEFILTILRPAYRSLGLSFQGRLTGWYSNLIGEDIMLAVPALNVGSITSPWDEYLWDTTLDDQISLPRTSYETVLPPRFVAVGQEFEGTVHRILTIGEDLGFLKRSVRRVTVRKDESVKWLFKAILKSQTRLLYDYEFIAEPPKWWTPVVDKIVVLHDPVSRKRWSSWDFIIDL